MKPRTKWLLTVALTTLAVLLIITATQPTQAGSATSFTESNSRSGISQPTTTAAGFSTPVVISSTNYVSGTWYVSTGGDDANDCLSPAAPCATISGAIVKASPADIINVAMGVYTSTAPAEVVLANKSIALVGGWTPAFDAQAGRTTIGGGGARRGLTINAGTVVTLERFTIQNGLAPQGGGIYNSGDLTIVNSDIVNNHAVGNTGNGYGGGIYTVGNLIVRNSSISRNVADALGGGILKSGGTLMLVNTTISGNDGYCGGGIYNDAPGVVNIRNSTISSNTNYSCSAAGIGNFYPGVVTIQNTILAQNNPTECSDQLSSAGYNLIGNLAGCTYFTPASTDLVNVNARLGALSNLFGATWYQPPLSNSPVINAGDPTGCIDQAGQPLNVDQRGLPRVGRCDMGAVEWQALEASTKTANVLDLAPGQSMTYTISLSNTSAAPVNSVVITDVIPDQLTYKPGSLNAPSGSYGYAGGVITWTGTINPAQTIKIKYGVTLTQWQPGSTLITNTAFINYDRVMLAPFVTTETHAKVYCPLILRNYCSTNFFDDFSNPTSGWPVGDDSYVRTEYLKGEYRVLAKNPSYMYLFRSPACTNGNYTVEADVHWSERSGSGYSVMFDTNIDFSQYYLFYVNTDYKVYALLRRDPGGFTYVADFTQSQAINASLATNHLKVTRNGSQITLNINGTVLGTWLDGPISGNLAVGLSVDPYSNTPNADARFDNFSVKNLPGGRPGPFTAAKTSDNDRAGTSLRTGAYADRLKQTTWRLNSPERQR